MNGLVFKKILNFPSEDNMNLRELQEKIDLVVATSQANRETVQAVYKLLYGNGQKGLFERVTVMETLLKDFPELEKKLNDAADRINAQDVKDKTHTDQFTKAMAFIGAFSGIGLCFLEIFKMMKGH